MAQGVGVKFAIDKQAHFWWGAFMASCTFPAIGFSGVMVAALIGLAKEYWDSKGHGTPDVYDFLATALGGLAGAVVTWGVTLLTN